MNDITIERESENDRIDREKEMNEMEENKNNTFRTSYARAYH
jgi:hypothetical protein